MAEEGQEGYQSYVETKFTDVDGSKSYAGHEIGVVDNKGEKTPIDYLSPTRVYDTQEGPTGFDKADTKYINNAYKRVEKAAVKLNKHQDNPDKQAKILDKAGETLRKAREKNIRIAEKAVVKEAEAVLENGS